MMGFVMSGKNVAVCPRTHFLYSLPLRTDTYIDELLEIFLKLLMKTEQVHLIIGTTLFIFVITPYNVGSVPWRLSLRSTDAIPPQY